MTSMQSVFEQKLTEYFCSRVREISEAEEPPLHEDTVWYTGSMLARFGDSRQLFHYDQGEVSIRPLALLYKDAHETSSAHERCLILRQLGDLALFLGALFPDNYARRGIHRTYFIGMGGAAYDYLSENAAQGRHVFSELAETFARMLELVGEACNSERQLDSTDILNLYRRWQATGNPLVRRQLEAAGVELPEPDQVH